MHEHKAQRESANTDNVPDKLDSSDGLFELFADRHRP
jgi:hypothetical protein